MGHAPCIGEVPGGRITDSPLPRCLINFLKEHQVAADNDSSRLEPAEAGSMFVSPLAFYPIPILVNFLEAKPGI
jgi:hypothetical protein